MKFDILNKASIVFDKLIGTLSGDTLFSLVSFFGTGIHFLITPSIFSVLLIIMIFILVFFMLLARSVSSVKGCFIYKGIEIKESSHNGNEYIEAIIYMYNCSKYKIFFKMSENTMLVLQPKTEGSTGRTRNIKKYDELVKKEYFILPHQTFTIHLPILEIPNEKELDANLSLYFDYGKKTKQLKHKAFYEIMCELQKKNQEYGFEYWEILNADI